MGDSVGPIDGPAELLVVDFEREWSERYSGEPPRWLYASLLAAADGDLEWFQRALRLNLDRRDFPVNPRAMTPQQLAQLPLPERVVFESVFVEGALGSTTSTEALATRLGIPVDELGRLFSACTVKWCLDVPGFLPDADL